MTCAVATLNDSLVLVNHVNELRDRQKDKPLLELVAMGAVEHLRPILLTTISTVARLMPQAYGLDGVDPYMSPMTVALDWGLLFATLLTLFLMSCLHVIGHDMLRFVHRYKHTELNAK